VNLPIGGVIAAFLFFVNIPDRMVKPDTAAVFANFASSMDLVGFAIFAPAAIQVLLALQYGGNQYAWDGAVVIGLLCGGVATFVLFFCWEYRKGVTAMVPLSLLRNRVVWSSCATMFFNIGVTNCTTYYLPVFLQAVKDQSPITSGVNLLPNILVQVVMAMVSGVLGTSISLRWGMGRVSNPMSQSNNSGTTCRGSSPEQPSTRWPLA
jgi:hypothetical protein